MARREITPIDPVVDAVPIAARSRRYPASMRWLVHLSLLLCYAAVAGIVVIWPEWVGVDGARTAVELQSERETDLSEQLMSVRSLNEQLRDWKQDGRRIFLESELKLYPGLVKAVARREGTELLDIQVGGLGGIRWKPVRVENDDGVDAALIAEIQPRSVHVSVSGDFERVYRTVASLCQQQQLFVPDRWDIRPGPPRSRSTQPLPLRGSAESRSGRTPGTSAPPGYLTADVWGTIFTVREAGRSSTAAPSRYAGSVAANVPWERP